MNALLDHEIEEAARHVLLADSRVDEGEVVVHVENKIVFLSGTVDSAAERQAVLEDMRTLVRVDDVVDDLALRNYVERTDEELTEAVKHALARDIIVDSAPISVLARNGKVVLSGRIDSYSRKHAAEDVTWWTSGVTNVVSHLVVEDEIPADLKE